MERRDEGDAEAKMTRREKGNDLESHHPAVARAQNIAIDGDDNSEEVPARDKVEKVNKAQW